MSYTVEHFQSLIQRFPSWDELRAHLEGAAGGKLRVVQEEGARFAVLRYVKGQSDLRSAELGVGLFRSVVWDTVANLPVCVAPQKARDGVPPVGVQLSATEDFVDGVMVNAFWSAEGGLQLATRTSLGATGSFYSEKSFAALFDEAVAASPLKTREALGELLEGVATGANASAAFASFVLQHPEHRVVAKVNAPALYVVHVGHTMADGAVKISERAVNWPQALGRFQIPSYPVRKFASEAEAQDLLRRTGVQRGWRWQGLVFKDGSGGRWRMRTPTYTMLRELRGAEAQPVDRFLRLRREHKISEYLKHYSEERDSFWEFEEDLRAATRDVLAAYTDVHKAHAVAFKDLPEAYRPAVFLLHKLWREELREKKYIVRLQEAIRVVGNLRDFEQKRLMDAEEYVPVAPPREAADAQAADAQAADAEPTDAEPADAEPADAQA